MADSQSDNSEREEEKHSSEEHPNQHSDETGKGDDNSDGEKVDSARDEKADGDTADTNTNKKKSGDYTENNDKSGKKGKEEGKKRNTKSKEQGKEEDDMDNNSTNVSPAVAKKKKEKEDKGKKTPTKKSTLAKSADDGLSSPRGSNDKLSIAFKIVDLATDFAKNSAEILRAIDENKPKLLPKIGKKIVPPLLGKLMKPNTKDTEFDKRRQLSLGEFARVTEELRTHLGNSKAAPPESEAISDLKQHVEDGHMFLSAVLQKELAMVVALHNEDKKAVTAGNLHSILSQAHTYCDHVSTMKFPAEWESLLEEVNPKYKKEKEKKIPEKSSKSPDREGKDKKEGKKEPLSPGKGKGVEEKLEEIAKNVEVSEDGDDTQTVQIEIRGNTGGFVGSVIDFDLVVTHEDGSPVKVDAAAFAVDISGPAAKSAVNIMAKGEGAFRIEFIPEEEGPNTLSIYMHEMLLTSGIRSIISRAGELAFLVHTKDISRGQLQGISVVPNAVAKELSRKDIIEHKLAAISQCTEVLKQLRTKFEVELEKELDT